MNNRLDLLNELSHLEEMQCTDCELVTKQGLSCHEYMPYCLNVCNIGKRMQEIGRILDPTGVKAKESTKLDGEMKSKIIGMYQFKTPRQIAERYGLKKSIVAGLLTKWVKDKKIILDHYKYDSRRIIELDHQGLGIDEIANKTGSGINRIKGVLEREYKRQREGFGRHE